MYQLFRVALDGGGACPFAGHIGQSDRIWGTRISEGQFRTATYRPVAPCSNCTESTVCAEHSWGARCQEYEENLRQAQSLEELAEMPVEEILPEHALKVARNAAERKDLVKKFALRFCFRVRQAAHALGYFGDIPLILGAQWTQAGRGVQKHDKKTFMDVVANFFYVIVCPEPYSSQLCMACLGRLEFLNEKEDLRRKVTGNVLVLYWFYFLCFKGLS